MKIDQEFKQRLHQHCIELCDEKINTLNIALQAQKDVLFGESKSSAGDKYETSRAMAHLEQEKLSKQLKEVLLQKNLLESIDPNKKSHQIQSGSMIGTNRGPVYISIGMGKVKMDGIDVFVISPSSPIGQMMLGKSINESFDFNGTKWEIQTIE